MGLRIVGVRMRPLSCAPADRSPPVDQSWYHALQLSALSGCTRIQIEEDALKQYVYPPSGGERRAHARLFTTHQSSQCFPSSGMTLVTSNSGTRKLPSEFYAVGIATPESGCRGHSCPPAGPGKALHRGRSLPWRQFWRGDPPH